MECRWRDWPCKRWRNRGEEFRRRSAPTSRRWCRRTGCHRQPGEPRRKCRSEIWNVLLITLVTFTWSQTESSSEWYQSCIYYISKKTFFFLDLARRFTWLLSWKHLPGVKISLNDGFEGLLEVDGHLQRLSISSGSPLPFAGAEHGRAVLTVDQSWQNNTKIN